MSSAMGSEAVSSAASKVSGVTDGRERPRRGAAGAVLWAIHVYQLARHGRPTSCRFLPTCSSYAVEAIERHGLRTGGWLALRRIARCHPWGGHGIDPVPDRSVR